MINAVNLGGLFVSKVKPPKEKSGYIAGRGNGLLTVNGKPDTRRIVLMERTHMFPVILQTWSYKNGQYLFTGLDPSKEYLVMAVDDYKQYEPVAWDFIKPAVDNDSP